MLEPLLVPKQLRNQCYDEEPPYINKVVTSIAKSTQEVIPEAIGNIAKHIRE